MNISYDPVPLQYDFLDNVIFSVLKANILSTLGERLALRMQVRDCSSSIYSMYGHIKGNHKKPFT